MSGLQLQNPVLRWIEHRLPIFSFLDHSVGSSYPSPRNLSYWWNFGSLAGLSLIILIFAINLVGDQVRDQLNPRLKR